MLAFAVVAVEAPGALITFTIDRAKHAVLIEDSARCTDAIVGEVAIFALFTASPFVRAGLAFWNLAIRSPHTFVVLVQVIPLLALETDRTALTGLTVVCGGIAEETLNQRTLPVDRFPDPTDSAQIVVFTFDTL